VVSTVSQPATSAVLTETATKNEWFMVLLND
jgi:hypothetical protein